jgi:hypothetical protein
MSTKTLDSLIEKISGKVHTIVERGDLKIVLYTEHRENRGDCFVRWNVVAVDKTPKIVWRAHPGPDLQNEDDTSFTSIYEGKNNELLAYGGAGYDYIINDSNGQTRRWIDPNLPAGHKIRAW